MLKDMLQELMAKFKVGGVPQINPTAMDMSLAHRQDRQMLAKGGMEGQMADMMEGPTHTMPDGTVHPGATHEEYEQMLAEGQAEDFAQEGMVPDEEMEEDYVEFIMSEALEPEEQQYLSEKLVEDDQLSMIFDKVVETASEFSGSGSVEGPGTGISDSIPARLSDGEFVMTAKATDAIGADTLDELMALAEQEADAGRQAKQLGGVVEEEDVNIKAGSQSKQTGQRIMQESLQEKENKRNMMLLNPRNTLLAQ